MARHRYDLEAMSKEEFAELEGNGNGNIAIDLSGRFVAGTENADIRCGKCGRVFIPGYSPRAFHAGLGSRFRGPFFFRCGCEAEMVLRFVAPL